MISYIAASVMFFGGVTLLIKLFFIEKRRRHIIKLTKRAANIRRLEIELGFLEDDSISPSWSKTCGEPQFELVVDELLTAKVVNSDPEGWPDAVLKTQRLIAADDTFIWKDMYYGDYQIVPRRGGRPPYVWRKGEPALMMVDHAIEGYIRR